MGRRSTGSLRFGISAIGKKARKVATSKASTICSLSISWLTARSRTLKLLQSGSRGGTGGLVPCPASLLRLCNCALVHNCKNAHLQSGAECFLCSLLGIKLIDCEFEQFRVIQIQTRPQESYPFKGI